MVDGAPEIKELAIDLHNDLVQMPAQLRIGSHLHDLPLSDLGGEYRPKPVRINRFGDANGGCSAFELEDAAEVQLSSCPGAQPIQSGAPSRHEASLQAETLCSLG